MMHQSKLNRSYSVFLCCLVVLFIFTNSCKEEERPVMEDEPEKPTITDIDGNVYDIVEFADNWWMVQNLRASRYTNGEPIPEVADAIEWSEIESPAFCWFDNNSDFDDSYGKMYNWYAATCCSICPEGWRLPNETDIQKVADRRLTPPMLSLIYIESGWADEYTFNSGMRLNDGTFFRSQISDISSAEFTFRWGLNSQQQKNRIPHGFTSFVNSSDDGTGYASGELTANGVFANKGDYIRCVKIK